MGASFTVVNDTKQTVCIDHGVCKAAIIGSVAGVATVLTAGAAGAAFGIFGAVAVVGVLTDAAVVAGANAVTVTTLLMVGAVGLSHMKLTQEQTKALKKAEEKLKSFRRIKPGESYKVDGTLSLVQTVYVVTDDFTEVSKNCFTGSTDGSNRIYKLSEDFNIR